MCIKFIMIMEAKNIDLKLQGSDGKCICIIPQ